MHLFYSLSVALVVLEDLFGSRKELIDLDSIGKLKGSFYMIAKSGLTPNVANTTQELSFQWSYHRISSTDLKMRTMLYSIINSAIAAFSTRDSGEIYNLPQANLPEFAVYFL